MSDFLDRKSLLTQSQRGGASTRTRSFASQAISMAAQANGSMGISTEPMIESVKAAVEAKGRLAALETRLAQSNADRVLTQAGIEAEAGKDSIKNKEAVMDAEREIDPMSQVAQYASVGMGAQQLTQSIADASTDRDEDGNMIINEKRDQDGNTKLEREGAGVFGWINENIFNRLGFGRGDQEHLKTIASDIEAIKSLPGESEYDERFSELENSFNGLMESYMAIEDALATSDELTKTHTRFLHQKAREDFGEVVKGIRNSLESLPFLGEHRGNFGDWTRQGRGNKNAAKTDTGWRLRVKNKTVNIPFAPADDLMRETMPPSRYNQGAVKMAAGRVGSNSTVKMFSDAVRPAYERYGGILEKAADATGVEPELLLATMIAESSGNSGLVSPAGAVGLMQIMPSTAKSFGSGGSEMWIPSKNIMLGAQTLADNLQRNGGDIRWAVSEYNYGGKGAKKKGRYMKDLPEETRKHNKRIMALYKIFMDEGLFAQPTPVVADFVRDPNLLFMDPNSSYGSAPRGME